MTKSKILVPAAAALLLAASAGQAAACGCCGGEKAKSSSNMGCGMGGMSSMQSKSSAGSSSGMRCMGGMSAGAAQKQSDDMMMDGMDHSKMQMPKPSEAPAAAAQTQRAITALAAAYLKAGSDQETKALAEAIVKSEERELEFLQRLVAAGGK